MAGRRQDRVEIGYVARAHGIRGEVRIVTHDPESSALSDVDGVFLGGQRFTLASVRPTSGAWLVTLQGVSDRNRAEELKGQAVEVERDQLELDDDDVLLTELVGCQAVLESGEDWGEIVAIELGAQDRLVVHNDGLETLLPVVDEFIRDIDLQAGRVVVAPPEGLPQSPAGRRR